jgi:type IV secretory pathway VirB10-like protein
VSISSKQKTWILFGILVIIGGAAFVYFDPLELNLLGPEPTPVVVKPAPPHVAAPAPKPPVPKPATPKPVPPNPAAAPPHASPVHAAVPALAQHVALPPKTIAPVAAMSAEKSETAKPVANRPAAVLARTSQPPLKSSKTNKATSKPAIDKPMRPKNLDLRHCLDLKTDAAIAKCAGE